MADISPTTQDNVTDMTNKFNSRSFVDKLFGRNKDKQEQPSSDVQKDAAPENKTATRLGPLEKTTEMVDMLMKIYNFLRMSYDEDKEYREKKAAFREEEIMEAEKRHQRLLDALSGVKAKKTKTEEKQLEKMEGGDSGFLGTLGDVAATKATQSILGKVGSALVAGGVMSAAAVAAILGVPVMLLMANQTEEEAQETTKSILGASGGTSEATATAEAIRNTDVKEKKKMNLLADRPRNKKSFAFWKDPELQKKYLEEIGWDDNTGTTQAERDAGYIAIDETGKLIKAPESKTTPDEPTTTPSTPPTPAAAVPLPSSTPSSSYNAVQQENNASKLDSMVGDTTVSVSTTPTQSTPNKLNMMNRPAVPAVRNSEESFQKMIYYSTRVV